MTVFAYIDRSRFATSVLRHAVWAAKQLDLPVEIIHVLDQPGVSERPDYSGRLGVDASETAVEERIRIDAERNRLLIAEGHLLLDTVAGEVRAAGIKRVSVRLYQGTVLDHLQQHVNEATLVIVGKRGEGAHRNSGHLGRNIERLVRGAHRPVLIVPEEFSPIISATIAWDGGKSSGEAIHFLAMRPLLRGLRTVLLHVGDHHPVPPALHDARAHLQGAGLDVDIDIQPGAVTDAILGAASELLVIGAYGHSRIRHLVIGSTTTEILMRATSSVLVFH